RRPARWRPLVVVLAALVVAIGLEAALDRGWVAAPTSAAIAPLAPVAAGPTAAARGQRAGPDLGDLSVPPANAPRPSGPGRSPETADVSGPPPCSFDDLRAPRSSDRDWATTLVDTAFALPDDYTPPDLVPVGRSGIAGA